MTLAKIGALSYGYHTGMLWLSYGKGSARARLWALSGRLMPEYDSGAIDKERAIPLS